MKPANQQLFPKTPAGTDGLDEITGGGFPRGRTTLVCGSAGSGKTLMTVQFLVKGITEYDEPGVFMSLNRCKKSSTGYHRVLVFGNG
jgi:circadian clock protein KaiC